LGVYRLPSYGSTRNRSVDKHPPVRPPRWRSTGGLDDHSDVHWFITRRTDTVNLTWRIKATFARSSCLNILRATPRSSKYLTHMREPNFSESQLQQAANTAFIRTVVESEKRWISAHILSLPDEFLYGWDTAFYLDWIHLPPPQGHEGCNFFIQYKLSNQYTSTGAAEWGYWKQEYFRFKIPHSTKDAAGKYIDDYHQWDRLKELAAKKYPTYYATNATLSKSTLFTALENGNLLSDVPLLDVRTVKGLHKHVTFTSTPGNFRLHSELEVVPIVPYSEVVKLLGGEPQTTIGKSNSQLFSALREMKNTDENWKRDLARMDQDFGSAFPERLRPWAKHQALRIFVKKHIGAVMFWHSRDG
jgi:hypothetical protein